MPQVLIRGGELVEIDSQQARKLEIMKFGKGAREQHNVQKALPPETGIRLDGYGMIELREIRKILDDKPKPHFMFKDGEHERNAVEKTKKELRKEMMGWTAERKSIRMCKFAYIMHRSRGNKGSMSQTVFKDPLHSKLLGVLVPYFEKHPKEVHAPIEIYQGVLPKIEKKIEIKRRRPEGWRGFI